MLIISPNFVKKSFLVTIFGTLDSYNEPRKVEKGFEGGSYGIHSFSYVFTNSDTAYHCCFYSWT